MTNIVRLSNLPEASETATAEASVVQNGETKKFTLGSAAGKTAGASAGNVPVLATGGVLSARQGGTGLDLQDNSAQPSRYFGRDGAGALGFHSLPSGGGGGGGTPDDGSVTWTKTASGARADEEDILDGTETADTKFVGNKTLRDVITEVDNQVDWGAWSAAATLNINDSNLASFSGPVVPNLPAPAGTPASNVFHIVNASTYNAGTSAIAAGGLCLFTSACSGMPTLSSGTLRGLLVIENDAGERWGMTIANPEAPDAETCFQYVAGSWVARGYRGNEMRTSYGGLYSNNRWEVFSALARGGPATGALADSVCFAKRNERRRIIIRASYDTASNPDRYQIFTSASDYAFDIAAGEVGTSELADGAVVTAKLGSESVDNGKIKSGTIQTSRLFSSNTAAANKWLKVNGSDVTLFEFADAPSGSTPSITEEEIYTNSTGLVPGNSGTLASGKAFADYNEIYFVYSGKPSPIFSRLAFGTSTSLLCFDCGGFAESLHVNKTSAGGSLALNSFFYGSSNGNNRLQKIVGRKFA